MGLRFRKSIKIAPGVKININKNSIGLSAGVKGARISVNSKGRVTKSVGIPGTGIYYTETNKLNSKNKQSNKANAISNNYETQVKVPFYKKTWFSVLFLILFYPIGLFTMWKYTNWNKVLKIIITIIFSMVLISALTK